MGQSLRATLVLLVCFVAMAGCQQAAAPSSLKLAFTGTLTGDFAFFAQNMQKATDLAIDEINTKGGVLGAQIEKTSVDDTGAPAQGPIVAQQLCDDASIDVVTGYTFSSVAIAAVPVYEGCKMPVLASGVTSPKLSGSSTFFHRNIPTGEVQGAALGKYAVETLGLKRFATLRQVDDYGDGVTKAFEDSVKASGGEIISSDGYQLGEKDFRPVLTNVEAKAPDAIFIGGFYNEAAKIAQQARDVGIKSQFLGADGTLAPDLISLAGQAAESMVVVGVFRPRVVGEASSTGDSQLAQDFVTAFAQKHNASPDALAALSYDAVYTVKAAAEAGGGTSREAIQKGLGLVKDVPGVTGGTTFDANGDRQIEIQFFQVKNGAWTELK